MFTAFISVHSDIRNMIQNSLDSEKIFQKQKEPVQNQFAPVSFCNTFYASFRSSFAASTRCFKLATVSGTPRVFNPQSGFTQSFSGAIRVSIFSRDPLISYNDVTRGEWISYTPGPTSVLKWFSFRESRISRSERDASNVMTSASMSSIARMISVNSL